MKKFKVYYVVAFLVAAGFSFGIVASAGVDGLDTWKSGKNHNKIIDLQKNKVAPSEGEVDIAFFSNSAFRIISPNGISIMVDPWRNDPSGAWGLWYRMEFPVTEVDIGLSTHAHFDHDAIGRLEAHMLLDRMAGEFKLGDVKITGIADKHQCIAPGVVAWTEAVKQFQGTEKICAPDNARHFDNTMYLIETGGLRILMWGDNRPNPPQNVLDKIGKVDIVVIPVDGSQHILDYNQADSVLKKVSAKAAIPHHYLVPSTTFYTSTLQNADEWVKSHKHTLLTEPSFKISKKDLAGKKGHVYYFGSNNMVK